MSNKIVDPKPKNEIVFDPKPRVETVDVFTDRLYEMTLKKGMLIGLGPHITYSDDIDIISSKSP